MKIVVDRRIYPDACITNAVYWLADRYTCARKALNDFEESVDIEPLAAGVPDAVVANEFWGSLNDYKLREQVKAETRDIRTILYIKAFSDCDDLTEEDIYGI